uniref:Uncharacterized protein n=1 Tax=Rhizophora mucronata TaxID=61149 RepID=A0A2P2PIS5_RHIMU
MAFHDTTFFSGISSKNFLALSKSPSFAYPTTIVVHDTTVFFVMLSKTDFAASRSLHFMYMSISALVSRIVKLTPVC